MKKSNPKKNKVYTFTRESLNSTDAITQAISLLRRGEAVNFSNTSSVSVKIARDFVSSASDVYRKKYRWTLHISASPTTIEQLTNLSGYINRLSKIKPEIRQIDVGIYYFVGTSRSDEFPDEFYRAVIDWICNDLNAIDQKETA